MIQQTFGYIMLYITFHIYNTQNPKSTHQTMSRRPTLLLLSLRKLTFQRPKPLSQSILATSTKTIALFLGNDLHTVGFAAGYGVNLDGIDDVGERDD